MFPGIGIYHLSGQPVPAKKVFLIPNVNLLSSGLKLIPLLLSLDALVKSLSIFLLSPLEGCKVSPELSLHHQLALIAGFAIGFWSELKLISCPLVIRASILGCLLPCRMPAVGQVVKEHTGLCTGLLRVQGVLNQECLHVNGCQCSVWEDTLKGGGCIFALWCFKTESVFCAQEQFLVPDHTIKDISGASFAGFYYICFQKSAASIEGYYYHRSSEWYQSLNLTHVPEHSAPIYEFR
uniref:Uncharacterized protein n=1 Tax=Melopsittacus undulatus TaxID=13146 RepID=A0A8V5HDF9_MELUD